MSSELDIYEYRAALLQWHQENVGQAQIIFVAEDSHALLQEIRDDVLRYANSLTHRYAQVIDAMDLSAIQQHFSSDDSSARIWNHEDIQRLLRDLIRRKQEQLSAYSRYQSILGEWSDLIEWCNDLLPGRNHVMVSIEDSLPNFIHRLWEKYFDAETAYRRDQSPQDVTWLGKLSLLRHGGKWWERPDGMHFFYQLVDEHNELFGFY
ncbi:hypothetical protein C2W62_43080 [Candidatus Entotheonella serta]|nr:hypothetical protein C2W62_43080 [Candidatus Entotheonella serta]